MSRWTATTEMNHSVAIEELLFFIERVANGASTMRFLCGEAAFGMSLLVRIARQRSLTKNLVTLSLPVEEGWDETVSSSSRAGRVECLLASLSTQQQPNCNAFEAVFRRFADRCIAEARLENGTLICAIERACRDIVGLQGGAELASCLSSYCIAYQAGDHSRMKAVLNALVTGSSDDLNDVHMPLADLSLSELLCLLSTLIRTSGYNGLILFGEDSNRTPNATTSPDGFGMLVESIAKAIQDGADEFGAVLPMRPQSMAVVVEGVSNQNKPWNLNVCRGPDNDLQAQLAPMVITVPSLTIEDFARVG
ncbi:P-loop protein of unknown function [Cohaesibacter sp. ES.047]|uniref:BREX system ATP-binding domain-containing protein n=1 Tax=Cohaesibacter sp. ES.047 TaxID=1798205 RepID=UPI000BB87E79|nr:BREX system ATP-binding domain-containing protein [Cohaesibacter sp. ES.047]SNY92950.1 P-loop protein of unknown function [Cohaesibacter sp. ES.047]